MIHVMFAYDVEDVHNPASDDALLELCRIYSEGEVTVSMFILCTFLLAEGGPRPDHG